MLDKLTQEEIAGILSRASELSRAKIAEGNSERPFDIQRLTLDLSTAQTIGNPYRVAFPFRCVFVEEVTDTAVEIRMTPQTVDSYQSYVTLSQRDVWKSSSPISQAFLTWEAQTGKSVTLVFFVDSEFYSGSNVSQNSGGVAINEGSSFTTSRVSLTAATATAICSTNTSRKLASIQNNTGADVWLGNSSVSNTGANLGLKIAAGATFEWRNTAALYGYSVAGGSGDNGILLLEES